MTPKAPMKPMPEAKWPPHVMLTKHGSDARCWDCGSDENDTAWMPVAEHTHLLAEAVREAKAKYPPKDFLYTLLKNSRLTDAGCIEMEKGDNGEGYARIRGKRAHRLVWECLVGPIKEGFVLDHLCRNKACVNPLHLEEVSVQTNTLRGVGPTSINSQKDCCPRGHILRGDNVAPHVRAHWRGCRICRHASQFVRRGNFFLALGKRIRAALNEQRAFLLERGEDSTIEKIIWDEINHAKEASELRKGATPENGGKK